MSTGRHARIHTFVLAVTGAEIPLDEYGEPMPYSLGYWSRIANFSIQTGRGDKEFEEGWIGADLELAEEQAQQALEESHGKEIDGQADPTATQPPDAEQVASVFEGTGQCRRTCNP